MSAHTDPNLLRQHKREQRRNLSDSQQRQHAEQLTERLLNQSTFVRSQRIAAYLANDGEINPAHIIEQAWNMGKQVYLPVLSAHENSLLFAPFEKNSPMRRNHFGIDEPDCPAENWLSAEQMDLILLPLVAFDELSNRMGMGGGFYDRSLAGIRQQENPACLIGLAHEIQKTTQLTMHSWDIPLDAIATEDNLYVAARNSL
ncbi:MAG: 5-formyltetrahydrofolate cyclo-ligase [Gammaproteobacteria bacterium]|nr:5-formyltetrahydrofolate cyclo-ligase [Gammaproteobacteria bacterium]